MIQRLFAVGLSLESVAGQTDAEPPSERRGVVDDLDTTIRDIRRSIFELQSPRDSADLRSQLGVIVEDITPCWASRRPCRPDGPVDTLVSPEIRPHVVAVLREALTNVARHAQASAVQVHVDVSDGVTLTVRDDGKGYHDSGRSSGLGNMAERARSLGGSFSIQAASAGGTVLSWHVPLEPRGVALA